VDPALIGKRATQEPALRKSSRFRPISFCPPLNHAPRSQHEYNSCQYCLPWPPVDPDVGGNGDAAPSEFRTVILPLIWDLHSDCGLQWRGVKGGSLSFFAQPRSILEKGIANGYTSLAASSAQDKSLGRESWTSTSFAVFFAGRLKLGTSQPQDCFVFPPGVRQTAGAKLLGGRKSALNHTNTQSYSLVASHPTF
jgi:hypothetical protein